MVTTLLQVHHDVEERYSLGPSTVQLIKVSRQNPAIELPGMGQGGRSYGEKENQ